MEKKRVSILVTFFYRVLASLNLPAALEETRSGELPASLWEKALKLQNQGGIEYVARFITDLPEMLDRNKQLLDEVGLFSIQKLISRVAAEFYKKGLSDRSQNSLKYITR